MSDRQQKPEDTPPASLLSTDSLIDLCELAMVAPAGAIVEIGVYKGGSAWHLAQVARRQGRKLFLYDTFTGIPYQDPVDLHRPGDFGDTNSGLVRAAIPDAEVIEGLFPDSLVPMGPVAFVHADCDQYAAVKAICETLPPLMVEGGLIVFDDYAALEGARKAVDEVFGKPAMTRTGKALVRITHIEKVAA